MKRIIVIGYWEDEPETLNQYSCILWEAGDGIDEFYSKLENNDPVTLAFDETVFCYFDKESDIAQGTSDGFTVKEWRYCV